MNLKSQLTLINKPDSSSFCGERFLLMINYRFFLIFLRAEEYFFLKPPVDTDAQLAIRTGGATANAEIVNSNAAGEYFYQ